MKGPFFQSQGGWTPFLVPMQHNPMGRLVYWHPVLNNARVLLKLSLNTALVCAEALAKDSKVQLGKV